MKPTNGQPLTPRCERFCREYMVDQNATAAAKRAGYSEKTCHVQGPRLLADVRVASRITELQSATAKRLEVTADDVMQMLLDSYRDAKAANQHGPAVRAAELLGRRLGLFIDRTYTNPEDAISGERIVKKLSQGDPRKEALVREILGTDGFTGTLEKH